MIQQQIGDVLEIQFEGHWYYLVVLTKVVMFGGNIVFVFHNDGQKRCYEELRESDAGFNICTDLLGVKRDGLVKRIGKVEDLERYFKSAYCKGTFTHRKGVKAETWFIYRLDDLRTPVKQVKAMDRGTYSFDLVAEKVLQRYTPDQNEHI
jgi:hypothetical protein